MYYKWSHHQVPLLLSSKVPAVVKVLGYVLLPRFVVVYGNLLYYDTLLSYALHNATSWSAVNSMSGGTMVRFF